MQLIHKGLSLIWRVFDKKQILQQTIVLGNALKFSLMDSETLRATTTYKRCAEIVSLFSPRDIEGARYFRCGKDFDGGYVMLDNFKADTVDAAYSFGIGGNVSWEEDIANRGIDVFMYDHTISKLPKQHSRFHYFKYGITGQKKGANLKILNELLVQNGHQQCKNLIMKMDIEGCEWDVFQEVDSDLINQFSQIVIEFHGLMSAVYDSKKLNVVVGVLKKINMTHQSVHIHANGNGLPLWIGGLVMPNFLEVTYVRRSGGNHKFALCTRQFPTELDQPTFRGWPDIFLGQFESDAALK